MKNLKIFALTIFLFNTCISSSYAQESINASGGEASGSSGSVSYSIGQIVYQTISSSGNSESQGVQQPYEISVLTSISNPEGISLVCKAFPNPSIGFLFLEIEEVMEDLSYVLYDLNGRLLQSKAVVDNQTTIEMHDYVPATYMLQLVQNSKTIQTFKIIKN